MRAQCHFKKYNLFKYTDAIASSLNNELVSHWWEFAWQWQEARDFFAREIFWPGPGA